MGSAPSREVRMRSCCVVEAGRTHASRSGECRRSSWSAVSSSSQASAKLFRAQLGASTAQGHGALWQSPRLWGNGEAWVFSKTVWGTGCFRFLLLVGKIHLCGERGTGRGTGTGPGTTGTGTVTGTVTGTGAGAGSSTGRRRRRRRRRLLMLLLLHGIRLTGGSGVLITRGLIGARNTFHLETIQ